MRKERRSGKKRKKKQLLINAVLAVFTPRHDIDTFTM